MSKHITLTCTEGVSFYKKCCETVARSALGGQGPSTPHLHCREADMLSVEWDFSGSAVFVLEMQNEVEQTWRAVSKVSYYYQ